LKIADDFAHECLRKARFETRYFAPGNFSGGFGAPQPVVHGEYFRAVDSGSHFGLGCTLNRDHALDFVGVYYSTKSSTFKVANTAHLRLIDNDGNVGLTVDGEQVSLLAIRRFATDFIPSHYKVFDPKTDPDAVVDPHRLPPIKNCDTLTLPNGHSNWYREDGFVASESQVNRDHVIKTCFDITKPESGCQSFKYIEFFPSNSRQMIYQGNAAFWYIRNGGDLLVKDNVLKGSCGSTRLSNNLNIAHEVCDLPH
jgi:hypothetical protein